MQCALIPISPAARREGRSFQALSAAKAVHPAHTAAKASAAQTAQALGKLSLGQLLGELLHHLKLLEQPVYRNHLLAAAGGDAAFAAGVEDAGVLPLLGVMERMIASVRAISFSSIWAFCICLPI